MSSQIENLESRLTTVSQHRTKCEMALPYKKCLIFVPWRRQKTLVIVETRIFNPGAQLFMNTVYCMAHKGSFKRSHRFSKLTL